MPQEMTIEEIHSLVKDFGITAKNVKAAGFDGLEIHAGNGYLIAGFLSHFQNKRTDMYGGCFDNRVRILHEIYDEVRKQVGEDFPIQVRFSADEHEIDGRTIAESRMLAKTLEKWGVNSINCSNGVYGSFNLAQVSNSYMPHAWTTNNAKEIKEIVNIPVMGVNSIDDPLMAESLLEDGFCDFVGMSRCSLADPAMPNKAKEEKFDEIRPCVRCVQGCTGFVVKQVPIRCCVNPELGNEYKYTFEDKVEAKKVLIIGGGPGGMEAAMAAARRGHDVTLWEKEDRLGGELLAAIYPPGKGEFSTFLAYLIKQMDVLNVHVELNKCATAEEIKNFGADKVILATGGLPNMPRIPGMHQEHVVQARDVLRGFTQVEGKIIVAGGGEVGVETAMYLAQAERGDITIVEMFDKIAAKTDSTRVVSMKKFLNAHEVKVMTNTKVIEIGANGIVLEEEGVKKYVPCDNVVVSMGYHPNNSLAAELEDLGDKLVVIGDALTCANAMEAASTGFDAGYNA